MSNINEYTELDELIRRALSREELSKIDRLITECKENSENELPSTDIERFMNKLEPHMLRLRVCYATEKILKEEKGLLKSFGELLSKVENKCSDILERVASMINLTIEDIKNFANATDPANSGESPIAPTTSIMRPKSKQQAFPIMSIALLRG